MDFGEMVKQLRVDKGLTQKDLAKELGVSMRTVVNYEGGKSYPKDRNLYQKLANYFDVSIHTLLTGERMRLPQNPEKPESAEKLIQRARAMFAGGKLSEADKDAVMRAIQEAYWDAKAEKSKK